MLPAKRQKSPRRGRSRKRDRDDPDDGEERPRSRTPSVYGVKEAYIRIWVSWERRWVISLGPRTVAHLRRALHPDPASVDIHIYERRDDHAPLPASTVIIAGEQVRATLYWFPKKRQHEPRCVGFRTKKRRRIEYMYVEICAYVCKILCVCTHGFCCLGSREGWGLGLARGRLLGLQTCPSSGFVRRSSCCLGSGGWRHGWACLGSGGQLF